MSEAGGPVGRREVAVRCFAAEYDDASLEYSEGDEERAPNYVVTPTGARVNRLFAVGVLTEVESVSDDVLRGRVVDPTGAFVVYAGQYQPDARAALDRTEPPAFVAVTGKARTFRPDDGDRIYTSVRPESVAVVDAETRDRWTVQAAEQTLERVATAAAALEREERGEALTRVLGEAGVAPALAAGIPRAIEHYGTTPGYLAAVRRMAIQAAEVVAGEREEVGPLTVAPDEGGPVEADLAAGVSLEAEGAPDEAPAAATAVTEEPGSTAAGSGQEREAVVSSQEPAEPAAEEATPEPADAGAGADAAEAEAEAAETAAAEADADELYELDESEREAVEAEYGTEFETGNEVGGPGEAGIETPEPEGGSDGRDAAPVEEEPDEEEPDETVAAAEGDEEEAEADGAADADAAAPDDEPAGGEPGDEAPAEVDLVDAAVSAMAELDDGEGAERGAVVETVGDEHGVEEAAVEAAIQEALMGGRCYEPDDGRLKAI